MDEKANSISAPSICVDALVGRWFTLAIERVKKAKGV